MGDREGTGERNGISRVGRLHRWNDVGLSASEVGLNEGPVEKKDVVGLHGERRRQVLLIERFHADQNHANSPLLRLAHAFAQVLVASKQESVRDSPLD